MRRFGAVWRRDFVLHLTNPALEVGAAFQGVHQAGALDLEQPLDLAITSKPALREVSVVARADFGRRLVRTTSNHGAPNLGSDRWGPLGIEGPASAAGARAEAQGGAGSGAFGGTGNPKFPEMGIDLMSSSC